MTDTTAHATIQRVIQERLGHANEAVQVEQFITRDGQVDQSALDAWSAGITAATTRTPKRKADIGRNEAKRRFGTTRTEQKGSTR